MHERLPQLRHDITIDAHVENGQQYLVLHDTFGVADGPIMVHADMLDILEACDGVMTWHHLAASAGVDPDGPEIMQVRAFLRQLDDLGFFDTPAFETRRAQFDAEWSQSPIRPTICAGSTYPELREELESFLKNEMGLTKVATQSKGQGVSESASQSAHTVSHNVSHALSHTVSHNVSHTVSHNVSHAVLAPHIDFRVAPHVYAPAMDVVAESDAELIVMIGTSHYWGRDAVVLTEKHFETPLGVVETDVDLVRRLTEELGDLASATDLAHKPEHSLELHVVCVQYVRAGRPFRILPVLVTGLALEGDALDRAAAALRTVLEQRGEPFVCMISGDLAHVGHRFGDDLAAATMLPDVRDADRQLIAHLEQGNVDTYHGHLQETENAYRICGHAPTVLALKVLNPKQGKMLVYDVWDDASTHSAVSFVTMRFETH
jgi:hypothetical protein